MSWNYISTIHKGYAVSNSLMINIDEDGKILPRLMISRLNILECFIVKEKHIELDFQIEIFANVSKITKIVTDLKEVPSVLFILAENLDYGFVTIKNREIVTKCFGTISVGPQTINDLEDFKITQEFNRNGGYVTNFYLGLYALSGIFNVFVLKLINNTEFAVEKMFNVRLPLEKVIDISALYNSNFKSGNPLLAILSEEDTKDRKKIFQVFELNLINEELVTKKLFWEIHFSDNTTINKLQCLSNGDILFFSEIGISLYAQGSKMPVQELQIATRVDVVTESANDSDVMFALEAKENGEMYLLSNFKEEKTMEIGFNKGKSFQQLRIKHLGRVSLAKTLTHVGPSLIFIGSEKDNSYLLYLTEENTGDRNMPFLITLQNFSNLGFVSDLKLIKNETESTASLLAASFQKTSQQVNILRLGINLKIEHLFNLPTTKNFWLIKGYEDSFFFVSTSKETLSLRISHEKLKIYKNSIQGFEEKCYTINMHEIQSNLFAQVTAKGISLFQVQEMKNECVYSSKPGSFAQYGDIVLSANFEKDLYLVTKSRTLLHIDFQNSSTFDKFVEKNIEKQVSALFASKNFLFLSYWHRNQLQVVDRANLSPIANIDCEKCGIVSLYASTLGSEQYLYLFVGHIDGSLEIYQYSFMKNGIEYNFQISEKKSFKIGSQPISLQEYRLKGKVHILVSCDNSTSFYIKEQGQLSYVYLLRDNIKKLIPWSLLLEDHYFILSDSQIAVGYAEYADKLQTKSLPFEAQQEISFILPLFEQNLYVAAVNNTQERFSFLKLYDSNTCNEIESIRYEDNEISNLLHFKYEAFKGVLVSTFAQSESGRVEVYEIQNNNFYRKQVINFDAEVLSLSKLSDQYLVVTLPTALIVLQIEKNTKAFMDDLSEEAFNFKEVVTKPGHSLIWQIQTFDNYLLVLDKVKGLYLYLFNKEDKKLVLISKLAESSPGSASGCIIDENWLLLVSENTLRILKKNLTGESETDKMILQQKATINIGEDVTCLIKDKKTINDRYSSQLVEIDFVVFAGIKGSINVMAVIPERIFNLLHDLQQAILKSLPKGFGNDYNRWRSTKNFLTQELVESKGFVDAMLLKRLSKMSKKKIEEISFKMTTIEKPPLEHVILWIEELDKIC